MNTTKICLWSGPRNISTTLMYSFAQRQDTQVYDEPLYGHYLSNTDAKNYHPGAEDVLENTETDGEKVLHWMMGNHHSPVVFFKNMTHHLLELDRSIITDGTHVILTRNPKEMLPSFDAVIHNPSMADVGYAAQVEKIHYFQKENIPFVVLDSTRVLKDPEGILQRLCERIGIPFDGAMLSWEKGPIKEDGSWAKFWYKSIHDSTGFKPYSPKTAPFPEHLNALLLESLPLYEELLNHAL